MDRHRLRPLVALLCAALVLAGCTDSKEKQMDLRDRAEARAVEARAFIDELARQVGSSPEVTQDELVACEPGADTDDGLDLVYGVKVRVEPGTVERLRGEIADRYAAEGWTVRRDPENGDEVSTRFLKDGFSMGANVNEKAGVASVGGSGGCVR